MNAFFELTYNAAGGTIMQYGSWVATAGVCT
jgi:hypothetical protein